jgi:AcrR family transcriptional regulator
MSLGDIAVRAKVDRATIYYYFRSKEELFKELIADVVTRNVDEVERIAQTDESPAVKLRRAIEALLVSFATHNPYAAVYIEEFLSRECMGSAIDGLEDVRKLGRRYDRAVRGIIREGFDAGLFREIADERTVAAMVVGLMNSSVRWQRTTSVDAARRTAAAMAELVLGGLEASVRSDVSERRRG